MFLCGYFGNFKNSDKVEQGVRKMIVGVHPFDATFLFSRGRKKDLTVGDQGMGFSGYGLGPKQADKPKSRLDAY